MLWREDRVRNPNSTFEIDRTIVQNYVHLTTWNEEDYENLDRRSALISELAPKKSLLLKLRHVMNRQEGDGTHLSDGDSGCRASITSKNVTKNCKKRTKLGNSKFENVLWATVFRNSHQWALPEWYRWPSDVPSRGGFREEGGTLGTHFIGHVASEDQASVDRRFTKTFSHCHHSHRVTRMGSLFQYKVISFPSNFVTGHVHLR